MMNSVNLPEFVNNPLGLRIFEGISADIADLGDKHGHRFLCVCGKGTQIVLIRLPSAGDRAIDRAIADWTRGPILLNSRGTRINRPAAIRRLRNLAKYAGVRVARPHSHRLWHTFVTTVLDAGDDWCDIQIARSTYRSRTTVGYGRTRENLDRYPNYMFTA